MKAGKDEINMLDLKKPSISLPAYAIKKLFFIYKLFMFAVCSLNYIFLMSIVKKSVKNYNRKRRYLSIIANASASTGLHQCNIKYHVQGQDFLKENKNYLIASNHMSYLDILLLQSVFKNNCFISNKWDGGFLNIMSEVNDNYMINMSNSHSLRKELREVSEILKKGTNIILFPEGTSTDGTKKMNFHAPFFYTALMSKTPVLPVCINYLTLDDKPFSKENKDIICWHWEGGEQGFFPHFLKLSKIHSIKTSVSILPPISYENKTTRQLAHETREVIQKHFHPPQ